MYRITVLAETDTSAQSLAEEITRFCGERGLFPQIDCHQDQKGFFEGVQHAVPTHALIALNGVDGLNAAEHLRALLPDCRVIWCSDLDFSLQAFRLRADYFILKPIEPESLRQGLSVWLKEKTQQ